MQYFQPVLLLLRNTDERYQDEEARRSGVESDGQRGRRSQKGSSFTP